MPNLNIVSVFFPITPKEYADELGVSVSSVYKKLQKSIKNGDNMMDGRLIQFDKTINRWFIYINIPKA